MTREWFTEACDQQPDPESGARITRLTSAVCINSNVYCEQPYCSKDGNRVAVMRQDGMGLDLGGALMVADLRTLHSAVIERSIDLDPCTSAWSGFLYYLRHGEELIRFCLDTLTKEIVADCITLPVNCHIQSVSPDLRYCIAQAVLPGPTMGVLRIDLEGGGWDVIFEHPEITNSHLQYNPVNGRDILVQHNRGSRMAADGTILKRGDAELGATLMVIDGEGGNCRKLPAGPPHTAGCTGHECFVADTGKVAFTVNATGPNRELDSRYPEGNLFTAGPGDAEPTVFAAPEHYFNHLCVSKCGKYFVCDSYPKGLPGPVAIVIGNLQSGKYRAIVKDCRSTLSGAQCRHPHPYLTSENRHVVYNSDCDAIPHVYFAEVPDGFLAGLD